MRNMRVFDDEPLGDRLQLGARGLVVSSCQCGWYSAYSATDHARLTAMTIIASNLENLDPMPTDSHCAPNIRDDAVYLSSAARSTPAAVVLVGIQDHLLSRLVEIPLLVATQNVL